jgi:predicted HAD superfamily Cof-like phosphohydrolase
MMLRQCRLVLEETMELLEACGMHVTFDNEDYRGTAFKHNLSLAVDPLGPDDLAHIAKEASDVSVVTTGLLSECGIANVAIQEEVDAANLRKFAPGGYLDEKGKWRKPPDFKDADLKPILIAQGWQIPSDKQGTQADNA